VNSKSACVEDSHHPCTRREGDEKAHTQREEAKEQREQKKIEKRRKKEKKNEISSLLQKSFHAFTETSELSLGVLLCA
jgi:hypothetical protein